MTDQEIRLKILEAIAPVMAARAANEKMAQTSDRWQRAMTEALDELFQHAERLVFAKDAVGDKGE